jgi:hypothetical protein
MSTANEYASTSRPASASGPVIHRGSSGATTASSTTICTTQTACRRRLGGNGRRSHGANTAAPTNR